jgi:hypothetical protein
MRNLWEMMQSSKAIPLVVLVVLAGMVGRVSSQELPGQSQDSAPTGPFCLFPPRGASLVHARPTLVWSEVSGAARYVVECAVDSLFSHILVSDTVENDGIARVSTRLPYETPIYWRVGVQDSAGSFRWGGNSSLVTAPAIHGHPMLLAPSRRNETQAVWIPVKLPVRGRVEIFSAKSTRGIISIDTPFPWITSAHDSISVSAQWCLRKYGTARDTVVIHSDHGECTIPVEGSSPAPVLRSVLPVVQFGSFASTDTASARIMLRNITAVNDAPLRKVRTRSQFFSVAYRGPSVVAPSDSIPIPLRFHPRLTKGELFGRFVDTLLVEYDGGIERVLLQGESPPPRAVVDAQVLDFGEVAAQDTGAAVLRVANASLNALRLDSLRTRLRAFSSPQKRVSIKAFDTLDIPVRFVPARHGAYSDTLIVHNNSWRSPLRIPMRAVVPYPLPETDVPRVDFGPVVKGDTAVAVLSVGNASPSYLRIDSVRLRFRSFRLSFPQLPTVLMKGDSLRIGIQFRPDSLRAFSDTLLIMTNAADRVLRIPIVGTGSESAPGWGRNLDGREFALLQNFPNPFNATTTFRYTLPVLSHVRVEVFSTIGQSVALLADGTANAGYHDVVWHSDLPSGMYYCRFTATPVSGTGETFLSTRKVIKVK